MVGIKTKTVVSLKKLIIFNFSVCDIVSRILLFYHGTSLIYLTLEISTGQISSVLIILKLADFGKTNSLKMEVLLIFDSLDQEIDSTLNSNSALSPNYWSIFVNFLRTIPTINQKYLSPKFNIKAYKLQL